MADKPMGSIALAYQSALTCRDFGQIELTALRNTVQDWRNIAALMGETFSLHVDSQEAKRRKRGRHTCARITNARYAK